MVIVGNTVVLYGWLKRQEKGELAIRTSSMERSSTFFGSGSTESWGVGWGALANKLVGFCACKDVGQEASWMLSAGPL